MRRNEKLAISMFTHYEIHKGVWPGQASFWDEFFSKFEIVPFDVACSHAAAGIWKELRSRRINLDFLDLGIAATAVTLRSELAILNLKHFEQIDGLKLVAE